MTKYEIKDFEKIFENAGIKTINIEGLKVNLIDREQLRMKGKRTNHATYGEIDIFAIYKKVIILIEFTTEAKINTTKFDNFKSKIELLMDMKQEKLKEFIEKLKLKYPEEENLKSFKLNDLEDALIKGLYVNPRHEESEEETLEQRIPHSLKELIYIWGEDRFEYFNIICNSIREYSKYELFSFFEINPKYVFSEKELESRVGFSPKRDNVKIEKGIFGYPMITFRMSPNLLLEKAYVLRNEGWKGDSFQRMIVQTKLGNIRKYILEHIDTSFANNIIVSLSPDTEKEEVLKDDKFKLPLMFGSLCIIDGQHRLLAFTQDFYGEKKQDEVKNDELLKKLSEKTELLVTLIIFDGSKSEILRKQTQLFLDINYNQTKIKTDFIFNLREIIKPKSPESIGNQILRYLNSREAGVFKNKFEIRSYHKGRIKRSSIVAWGLKDIIDPEKDLIFSLASQTVKEKFKSNNIDAYVCFCGEKLEKYFESIKCVFEKKLGKECWNLWRKSGYMLLSTSSIVGFLRLYRHFIKSKIKEEDISNYIEKISVDFKRDNYMYTSSQWGKLEGTMFKNIREKYKSFGDINLIPEKYRV